MNSERRICVVTGSRAEYDLLFSLMKSIRATPNLRLQNLVTGMHLSPEFGLTYKKIEADGFEIDYKVESLMSSDTSIGITKSIGLGAIGISEAYQILDPDIVVLLGDRYEIFAAAVAALIARRPIAHIHGGETTEGAFDESIRHSITKMSHIHFTANSTYRSRVIQLGENPKNVFNVGALGLENIRRLTALGREELEKVLGINFSVNNLLVVWHPATLEPAGSEIDFQIILNALENFQDTTLIFSKSNADTDSRIINSMIDDYVRSHPGNAVAHTSLGQQGFLSTMKYVDGIVGNSSSGIIEAPSLNTGTVNIGSRQRGRVKAPTVIDCDQNVDSIRSSIARLFTTEYKRQLENVVNPYGDGFTSMKIVDTIQNISLTEILKKPFFDLTFECEND